MLFIHKRSFKKFSQYFQNGPVKEKKDDFEFFIKYRKKLFYAY